MRHSKPSLFTPRVWSVLFFTLALLLGSATAWADATFSTPGSWTWTCPSGVTSVQVECWGGGGAGGGALRSPGSVNTYGGGGGGGAYAKSTVTVVPGTVYTVYVGVGGAHSTTISTTAGSYPAAGGTNSWFGTPETLTTNVLAAGGTGGMDRSQGSNGAGGAGGASSACIGTTTFSGGGGKTASSYGGGGGGSAGTASNGNTATSSTGATAVAGGGAGGNGASASGGGSIGGTPGGGGGGGFSTGSLKIGGDGAPGKVVLTYSMPAPSAYAISVAGSSSATATASSNVNLTVTALDSTGHQLVGFYQDVTFSFYGLSSSPSNNAPTIKDKANATQTVTTTAGTPNVTLTFTNGIANVLGTSNGVLKAYNATGATTLHCTDGTASTASGLGAAGLSLTVTPAPASRLVFNTASQNISVNTISGTMTIQRQDGFGNPNTTDASVTVNLTSDSGTGIFRDTANANTIASVNINTGSSVASFKYTDATLGTPTLTAADAASVLAPASQLENIVALIWSATPATYNWNTTDANWTGAGSLYSDGNGVTFNDTGSAASPINLVGTLSPASVSVSTSTKNYTFSGSGSISGSATLSKSGSATLTIATANDYSGASTVYGGIVDLQNSTALGSSASGTTVAGGAAVQVDGNGLAIAEPLTLNGTGVASGGSLRNLANGNSVSGAITLASDARINSDAGTLTLSGSSISGATNLTVGGAGNVAIGDDISVSGKLTKDGTGVLTLSGNNSYAGNTTVSGGVLNLATASSVSASPTIILNGGELLGSGSFTVNNNIGIGASSGTIGTNALIDAASGQTFGISGVIASAGNSGTDSLTVNTAPGDNGTVVLSGANTFNGPTVISNGVLQVANTAALQNSTVNYNHQGGVLLFDSSITTATFGGLTGTQNLGLTNLSASAIALTVGSNNASTTYSGALTDVGSLTKGGTGKLTLTGNNSYSGGTLVSGGILELPASGVINGGAASVSAVSGAQLLIDGGALTATSGNVGTPSAGLVVSSGAANYSGALTMDLNHNNDALISVSGGTLTANSLAIGRTTLSVTTQPTSGSTAVGLYVNGGAVVITNNFELGNNANANSSVNARMDSGSLTVGGAMIFGLNNGGRWSDVDINGGTLTVNDTATGLNIGSSQIGNAVLLVRNGTVNAGKIGFGYDTLADTVVLSQTGSGSAIYVGSGGMAQVSSAATVTVNLNAGLLGANADWTGTVPMNLSGSAYTIKAADASGTAHNTTLNGALSGNAVLTKTGNGTLTLGAANTYSGNTLITAGTLALANDGSSTFGSIASGIISVAAGATFDVSQAPGYTLSAAKTIAGSGTVTGAFVAGANANISPAGSAAEGTLTFANGLTLGDANIKMDLSSDPTGLVQSNDAINVVGDVTATGTNVIVVTPVTSIGVGTYKLIRYTGTFYGDATNFACSIGTISTSTPGEIDLVISSLRPLANVLWRGDGAANLWDSGVSSNWLNGAALDRTYAGDTNSFDDSATNFVVTISGQVLPATASAVSVNATHDYTFTGNGAISGGTGLTKNNSGKLTIATTNDYTGVTTVNGGVLSVANLANGGVASAIGAASSAAANLVLNGGTLEYRGGNLTMDRSATLGASGGTISVTNSGKTLVLSGALTGAGSLTKAGAGSLTLMNPNTYVGGTVVSNGVLILGSNSANNDNAGGSALGATNNSVTFYGGTLQLFGYGGSTSLNFSNLFNPLVVPAGQTGTLQLWPRGPKNNGTGAGLASSLTGGGTLNLVVNYIRDDLDGDWSAFTGLINVTPKPSGGGDEMRINNTHGYANAAIFLNDGVLMNYQVAANATVDIGELGGTSGATVGTGSLSPANTTWRVGAKNTSATFAGTIGNDAAIIKVGTGNWTLTGANTYTGTTVVSNGVLEIDGSLSSSSTVTVAGGTLAGTGNIGGNTTVNAGANLSAGTNEVGTLTFSGNLTLNAGSINHFTISAGNVSNSMAVNGTLSPNGSVVRITSGSALALGTYTLFTYSSTNGTTFTAMPLFDVPPAGSASVVDNGSGQINLVISPGPSGPATITSSISGSTLTLTWPAGQSWRLESQTNNLSTGLNSAGWSTVSGASDGSAAITIDPAKPAVFYRLANP